MTKEPYTPAGPDVHLIHSHLNGWVSVQCIHLVGSGAMSVWCSFFLHHRFCEILLARGLRCFFESLDFRRSGTRAAVAGSGTGGAAEEACDSGKTKGRWVGR